MRNYDLIKHFIEGETKGKGSNLYIDRDELVNYSTVIATRRGSHIIANSTKYSATTNKNQSYVRYLSGKLIECPHDKFYDLLRDDEKMRELLSAFEDIPGLSYMRIE